MISLPDLGDENPVVSTLRAIAPFLDMENGPWVAGGCARKLYEGANDLGKSDVDIFFQDEDFHSWATSYFKALSVIDGWVISGHQETNAWSMFTATAPIPHSGTKTIQFQLLKKRFFVSPEELFDDFDFTVCMFSTDGKRMVADPRAIEDMKRRALVLHKAPPKPKAARFAKYCMQGFVPDPGVATAMFGVDTDKFFPTKGLMVDEY